MHRPCQRLLPVNSLIRLGDQNMFTKRFCVRSPYWAKRPVSICLDPPRQHHALHGHSAWIGTSGFWRGWTLRPSLCGREVGSGYAVPYARYRTQNRQEMVGRFPVPYLRSKSNSVSRSPIIIPAQLQRSRRRRKVVLASSSDPAWEGRIRARASP